jgi:hypothetical protein
MKLSESKLEGFSLIITLLFLFLIAACAPNFAKRKLEVKREDAA